MDEILHLEMGYATLEMKNNSRFILCFSLFVVPLQSIYSSKLNVICMLGFICRILRTSKMICCLLILVFLQVLKVNGSELQKEKVNYLSRDNGLAGESASKMASDYFGRMWIATSGGVSIFNGVQVATVPFEGQEGMRPSVLDICASQNNESIYASTQNSVYRFDSRSFAFVPIEGDIYNSRLLCDGKRLFVCHPKGFGVYENGKMKNIGIKGNPNVHCMALDPKDRTVWMLGNDVLYHYFPNKRKIVQWRVSKLFPKGTNFGSLTIVGNLFYIGTKNFGLFVYDSSKKVVRHIPQVGNSVTNVCSNEKGEVCVATDGSGAFLLNGATSEILKSFCKDKHTEWGLSTNAIYHYYRDKYGKDWFAQSRYGVVYTYYETPLFKIYNYGGFTSEALDVRSFCIDGSKRLIGTHAGLYYIDERKGVFRYYSPMELNGGNIVTGIQHIGNAYYIGTYDGGMSVLNAETLVLAPFEKFNKKTSKASVFFLKKSPRGDLWVGTDKGIAIVNNHGISLLDSENSGVPNGTVTSIDFSTDGRVWVSGSKETTVLSPTQNYAAVSRFPSGFFQNERYMCSVPQHGEMMYWGSRGGVFYANAAMSKWGRLTLPSGVVTESCRALCLEGESKLWMATDKGLFRCNVDASHIQHLGYSEGLASLVVAKDGLIVSKDTLWVATASGLSYLRLDDMRKWENDKNFHSFLYDIYINGESLSISQIILSNTKKEIALAWNFLSQSFRFKAMVNDFAKPNGRLFEYRLDESSHWVQFWHQEEISIGNLWPGKHHLYVRRAGTPGSETDYAIMVMPSAWFYVEMLLLILGICLLVAWYRSYQNSRIVLEERSEMEKALVEVEEQAVDLLTKQQDLKEMMHSDQQPTKYQQFRLTEDECNDIITRMGDYLEKERAYCNPNLKREDLARILHVNITKLSYIFSMHLKMNYYEYINRYRLEEFKRQVDEGACSKYTITALSERCGFKKSSFFSTFRKVEGMTPTEYLRRKNIKPRLL